MERKNSSHRFFSLNRLKTQSSRGVSASTKNLSKLRPTYSLSTTKSHKSLRSSIRQKQEKLESLKEEADKTWEDHQIPNFHKHLFLAKLSLIPLPEALKLLQTEIIELESGTSTIQLVIQAVRAREEILQITRNSLQQMDFQGQDKNLIRKEAIQLLKRIRNTSLEVLETIRHWKTILLNDHATFLYQGKNYLLKMKHDIDFISKSPLKTLLVFPKNLNTLFYISRPNSQSLLSVSIHLLGRIRAAEDLLSGPSKKKVKKSLRSSKKINSIPIILFNNPTKQPTVQKSEVPVDISIEGFIGTVIDELFPSLIHECFNEMISASLVLFSSSVLDKYIQEVLNSLIPVVAAETHQELNNIEYIEHQNIILNLVCELESSDVANTVFLETAAEHTANLLLEEVPYQEIIQEAIVEEKALNEQLVGLVYDDLVNCLFKEEWFEVIIEEEVGEQGQIYMWGFISPISQHKIWRSDPEKIRRWLADMVYFDILNDIVGELWLKTLVENCEKETDEIELPIPDYDTLRKQLRNSLGLGLSLWKNLKL